MALNDETKKRIATSVSEREAMSDPQRIRGLIRVELDAAEGVKSVAHSGGHDMVIDEPPERGGTGEGASPLAHFLAGVGA